MTASPRTQEFAELFEQHRRRLRGFILTLVIDRHEADEVLQETALVLWRKFDEFQAGSNFFAWGATVARFQILQRFERSRRERLIFQPATLEAIATQVLADEDVLETRQRLLVGCLADLTASQHELLEERYRQGLSPRKMAQRRASTVAAIYQQLSRIRRGLARCIERHRRAEERT
jgi:RNA polymerase sigma-70 factor (ECF subfamily)